MTYLRAIARAAAPKVDLDPLFAAQHGLATRRQLLAAGFDDEGIRRQLRSLRWQRVLPGLYANATGAITVDQRQRAQQPAQRLSRFDGLQRGRRGSAARTSARAHRRT